MKQVLKQMPLLYDGAKRIRHIYRVTFGPGRLRRQVRGAAPLQIVVGSGSIYDKGWIPTDVDYLDLTNDEHWRRIFVENSVDAILAEHVWEHLTPAQAQMAAGNCYKYLKPGGYLRVAVPDGFHPKAEYIDAVKVGGSGPGADDHKVLYNHESFRALFASVGFEVELLEYFDAAGQFHAVEWDAERGMVHRSKRFDRRNQGGELGYTSVILDARKPA